MSAADSEAAVDRLAEYAARHDDPAERAQHLFLALGILAWNAPEVLHFILDRANEQTAPSGAQKVGEAHARDND